MINSRSNKTVFLSGVLSILVAALGINPVHSQPRERDPNATVAHFVLGQVPGQLVVQYKAGVAQYSAMARTASMRHTLVRSVNHGQRNKGPMHLVALPAGTSVADAVAAYQFSPDVEYAQPNYIYTIKAAPNDASYATQQWGLNNANQTISSATYLTNNPPGAGSIGMDIRAEAAWDLITDCSSVTVAVVDSGVNYNHEDLSTNMANGSFSCPGSTTGTHGCDFVGAGDNNPMDLNGHGTHVAGIIGAVGNNTTGVAGVCWKAKILAVRVLDASGSGSTVDIVEGVAFAAGTAAGQGNAKVINMSLGGGSSDTAFNNALTTARDNGVVVVVAAGNGGSDGVGDNHATTPGYPCDYTQANILCVAAADQAYGRSTFTDYGTTSVDIAAPGTNILSTYAGLTTTIPETFNTAGALNWSLLTSGTPWGYSKCGSGAGVDVLMIPNSCATVFNGTSTSGYAASTWSDAYKTLTLPAGQEGVSLNFVYTMDLELGYDKFHAAYKNTAGNPFSGGASIWGSVASLTGEMNGKLAYWSTELSNCNGSTTCSIGFSLEADSSGQRAGIGILDLNITTMDTDVTNLYKVEDGTSMASPYVAGIATMVRARNPDFTYNDTVQAIITGGDDAPAFASYTVTGKTANAFGALKYIPDTTLVSVTSP